MILMQRPSIMPWTCVWALTVLFSVEVTAYTKTHYLRDWSDCNSYSAKEVDDDDTLKIVWDGSRLSSECKVKLEAESIFDNLCISVDRYDMTDTSSDFKLRYYDGSFTSSAEKTYSAYSSKPVRWCSFGRYATVSIQSSSFSSSNSVHLRVTAEDDADSSVVESAAKAVVSTVVIIGVVIAVIIVGIVVTVIIICCCCMKRRTSQGQVYRQPQAAAMVTTTPQSQGMMHPPPPQPMAGYQQPPPGAGYQPPPTGYQPPPAGYPPPQQAGAPYPPMQHQAYAMGQAEPLPDKATPTAPPPPGEYPMTQVSAQGPPPYPGN